ncbi:MAG: hypothetical protein ABW032_03205 [Burkholderiaceae bacterium]
MTRLVAAKAENPLHRTAAAKKLLIMEKTPGKKVVEQKVLLHANIALQQKQIKPQKEGVMFFW